MVWLATFSALLVWSTLLRKMTGLQTVETKMVFPHQTHELLGWHGLKFPAHIQGVLSNTTRHAGCVNARHIHVCRSDMSTGLTVHRLRLVFWIFIENCFESAHSQVDELQDLHVVRHIRVFLSVPLPLEHRQPIEFRLDQQCDERPRWIITHRFQCPQMLAADVVKASQYLTATFLRFWNFYDRLYVD